MRLQTNLRLWNGRGHPTLLLKLCKFESVRKSVQVIFRSKKNFNLLTDYSGHVVRFAGIVWRVESELYLCRWMNRCGFELVHWRQVRALTGKNYRQYSNGKEEERKSLYRVALTTGKQKYPWSKGKNWISLFAEAKITYLHVADIKNAKGQNSHGIMCSVR